MTRRWGLVLGGGGVLGAAWTAGALAALEDVHGLDARNADLLVGTSAGSVLAALLATGVGVADIVAHHRGETAGAAVALAAATLDDASLGGHHPPWPRLVPGSAALVAGNATRLRRLPPTAVLAALLPQGRASLGGIRAFVSALTPDGGWPARTALRVVAMDYDTGRRVAFGAAGAPPATLAEAVTASCAIPGWYTPVTIGGRRYVDGGACSSTNVDLAAGLGLDEVFVLAPMVSFTTDAPGRLLPRMERHWRARVTRRCLHEVDKVHRQGTAVTVLGPGGADLRVMGSNLMAAGRRRAVLETSLVTSRAALADPEPLSGQAGGIGGFGGAVDSGLEETG